MPLACRTAASPPRKSIVTMLRTEKRVSPSGGNTQALVSLGGCQRGLPATKARVVNMPIPRFCNSGVKLSTISAMIRGFQDCAIKSPGAFVLHWGHSSYGRVLVDLLEER